MFPIFQIRYLQKENLEKLPEILENSGKTKLAFSMSFSYELVTLRVDLLKFDVRVEFR